MAIQLDLELYREDLLVAPDMRLSVVHIAPDRPAQTIVLLHGFGGRAAQWQYQFDAFADRNRVIAIDLRGHGRSSRGATDYRMETLLADVNNVLDKLGVTEPFVLVGHSFGGAVATEMAVRQPERVRSLVLIASAGEYRLAASYRLAFRLPAFILGVLTPVLRGLLDASLVSLKRMFYQTLRSWRGWELFPRLTMPTMIIIGDRDRVFPQAAFSRVGEMVPNAEVVNVGVSAHMVMIERRDAVNRAIERFIELDVNASRHARWREGESGTSALLIERPWLVHYESGVPLTLDTPRVTLPRMLDRAWRRFPKRPALIYDGRTLTYKTVSAQAGRFANALIALGIEPGDRVMLLLPNTPQLVISYYGSLRMGAVVVMGNPLAPAAELARQAKHAGAVVLVTLDRLTISARTIQAQSDVRHIIYTSLHEYQPWHRWRPGQSATINRVSAGAGDFRWTTLLLRQRPAAPPVVIDPDAPAVIQFTSGTTGVPKGVTLSHYNLVANTFQTRAWMPNARDGQETVLAVVPFSHVYGMTAGMNLAVQLGATVVLLPTFDVEEVLEAIREYRPGIFPGVPAMYVAINDFPKVRRFNVQSIQACLSGAAPLPIEVKEAFEKLTKGKLVEGYGLSEAGPVTHANPIFGRSKAGSIGVPLPNTEARVIDLRTGVPLPAGHIGELVVRGPQVMLGYWHNDAATKLVLDKDGWLHTNDIARMDADGYFQIVSRRQDMWQPNEDTQAFPRDVEEVIYELPEVREAVVIAIANRPIAFVHLKEKNKLPAKTVIAFCERRLPPDLVPRLVIFVPDFPRSFIGKVLRRELVQRYRKEIAAGAGSVGEHLLGLDDRFPSD